ncbi:hypothetical protein [Tabrizicola sp.]|uniref:hypothetical protein n=1 Tax=Tabrizicola sp. TaxID=2005166 RepID=UPI00273395A3|nr:hypothetical protein [Tabrizicola sp.]MDP3196097.1 hypothetical protein [Tabrizicola sp.]
MTLTPSYVTPTCVTDESADDPDFTICTLVRSQEKYDRLLGSFARTGFTPTNSEFLAADNRDGNRFDGYGWQKSLLTRARGRFVVFCHDDVELLGAGHAQLLQALDDLDRTQPDWLLAGVAGGRYRPVQHHRRFLRMHISDPWGDDRLMGGVPGRVETLDECFIVMRRSRPVIGSYDLEGFHFYGPDLCLQAELLGGSAHVIDFHLRHHGGGTKDQSFQEARARFVQKYAPLFPGRHLHCTTGVVHLVPPDAKEGG